MGEVGAGRLRCHSVGHQCPRLVHAVCSECTDTVGSQARRRRSRNVRNGEVVEQVHGASAVATGGRDRSTGTAGAGAGGYRTDSEQHLPRCMPRPPASRLCASFLPLTGCSRQCLNGTASSLLVPCFHFSRPLGLAEKIQLVNPFVLLLSLPSCWFEPLCM